MKVCSNRLLVTALFLVNTYDSGIILLMKIFTRKKSKSISLSIHKAIGSTFLLSSEQINRSNMRLSVLLRNIFTGHTAADEHLAAPQIESLTLQ